MKADWDQLLAGVLRPARPAAARCLREHDDYRAASADRVQSRARTLAEIESRIGDARAAVFAAGTGAVGADMTALEREWLAASRAIGADRGLESNRAEQPLERFWARVAPEGFVRRLGADSAEAMATLASDPEGVERAERAVAELRAALSVRGVAIGARVEWSVSSELTFGVRAEELFAASLAELVCDHGATQAAHRLRRDVQQRLSAVRAPSRNSSVSRELGFLAFASALGVADVAPALAIYRLGYALTAANDTAVVLTSLPLTAPV